MGEEHSPFSAHNCIQTEEGLIGQEGQAESRLGQVSDDRSPGIMQVLIQGQLGKLVQYYSDAS
jgi:hypothetical protein